MKILLFITRAYLFGYGFIYLFAQLFFNSFEFSFTLAALAAFTAGSFGGIHKPGMPWKHWLTVAACCVGAGAIVFRAYDYYTSPHTIGNYYAWPEAALFVISFVIVAAFAIQQLRKVGMQHE